MIRQSENDQFADYWIARVITDALLDQDMATIETIVQRIDGMVPTKDDKADAANYMGDALINVMSMDAEEVKTLRYDDSVITTLAKSVFHISLSNPGSNAQMRKMKNMAIDMILQRTSGRINDTVRNTIEINYVAPDWMKGALGNGTGPNS